MSHKHKVRAHRWVDGSLNFTDREFDSLEAAMHFAKTSGMHETKIYDADDQLLHIHRESIEPETASYA